MLLPAVLQEIVHAIGHGPAMALVRSFGGQELRIPKGPGGAAWDDLVEVLGASDALRLAADFGGSTIYIALCMRAVKADRNQRMVLRYVELLGTISAAKAVATLVREFAPISYRQVEKIVNSPLPEDFPDVFQPDLF